MDLEHLTKHQIVLLTLLVSFVTSIATGIVTVSLVNQAPPGVTRTINQIVERTVEKVIPSTQSAAVAQTSVAAAAQAAAAPAEDSPALAVARMQGSLVRIVAKGGDLLVSRGVIVTAQGTALADRDALAKSGYRQFEAILPDGARRPATLRAAAKNQALAVLDIDIGTSTGFAPAPLANQAKVLLGQSVIRIGGGGEDTAGAGIIATLPSDAHPGLIEASVSSATPGSVLMTLSGELIGLTAGPSRDARPSYYAIPSQSLLAPPASS